MIFWLCLIGVIVSIYLIYIEIKLDSNSNYKPVCDINDRVSCSRAAKSSYAKLFGIPNAVLGVFFYIIVSGLYFFSLFNFVKIIAVAGILFSVYLAYISFVVQKNVCVLCTATYIINLLILFFAFF